MKYVVDHKKIKFNLEKMLKETESSAIIVTELAKEINMDTRLLKKHLEVMEIDKYGYFKNKKKKHIFVVYEMIEG